MIYMNNKMHSHFVGGILPIFKELQDSVFLLSGVVTRQFLHQQHIANRQIGVDLL